MGMSQKSNLQEQQDPMELIKKKRDLIVNLCGEEEE